MQSNHIAALLSCLQLFLTFDVVEGVTAERAHLPWSWECVEGACVRSEKLSSSGQDSIHASQGVCHLTCDKYGPLWPRPTGHTTISQKVLEFSPSGVWFDLSKVTGEKAREFLAASSYIFLSNLERECASSNYTIVTDVRVNVRIGTTSLDPILSWKTDESYSLEITTRGSSGGISSGREVLVMIRAVTMFGARHGLETLGQLVTCYHTAGRSGLVMVAGALVADKPVYPHRGLLLDTARHFLSVSAIKRTIDAMAASKLNVLHWHATDSQSFPLESPSVPFFTRYGAYSERERYSVEDTRSLIAYGQQRGVRLILEIDAPAHAGSGWQWGEEEGLGQLVVCFNQQPWRDYCIQPPCGQLNPANGNVYKVMRQLYRDMQAMFPRGEVIHMGGDEVFFPCWNSSADILNLLKSRGMGRTKKDFLQLWAEFQDKVRDIWDDEVGSNTTPIILWSSHLTDPDHIEIFLDKNRYVIETWVEKTSDITEELLKKGYRVIVAAKDAWYLDHGFWGNTVYHKWNVVYEQTLPRLYKGLLGGEVAMWGELVDDDTLDAKVWPRAAALAERLWSDPSGPAQWAEDRLLQHRQRLIKRGIRPEAITPEWCYQHQGQCN